MFPLPIFVLPGGIQRLRIFETKYLSMMAKLEQTQGFVIGIYQKQKAYLVPEWGTLVQIIDFDLGDDGVLNIDVMASEMQKLTSFEYQSDGLLTANATPFSHWASDKGMPNDQPEREHHALALVLKSLFITNEELSNLYKTHHFSYPKWVAARLFELIPLGLDEKERVTSEFGFAQVTKLLCSLCDIECETENR